LLFITCRSFKCWARGSKVGLRGFAGRLIQAPGITINRAIRWLNSYTTVMRSCLALSSSVSSCEVVISARQELLEAHFELVARSECSRRQVKTMTPRAHGDSQRAADLLAIRTSVALSRRCLPARDGPGRTAAHFNRLSRIYRVVVLFALPQRMVPLRKRGAFRTTQIRIRRMAVAKCGLWFLFSGPSQPIVGLRYAAILASAKSKCNPWNVA